jgi:uncharacterized protein DUF3995
VAAGWAAVFALLHVFWALGGAVGLAGSAGEQLATGRPGWFVALGLWGVAVLLVVGVCLGLALTRAAAPGRASRVLVRTGAAVGVFLLLRGLGIEVLLLAGVYDGNSALTAAQRHWSLWLWNPWFVAGGVAFLLAARGAARSAETGG